MTARASLSRFAPLAGLFASLVLFAGPAAAETLRLEPGAVCRWGTLGGASGPERVLLCPARDAQGRKAFRIVERRPLAQTGPVAVGARDGRGAGFSPQASATVGATAAGSPLRAHPSGRVGVGSSLGAGRVVPRVGVGVGFPSGRVSAGVGTSVGLGGGVRLGTGLSVPLGRF